MDLIMYRGYFIHLRGTSQSWRFMAAPSSSDLPILSRGTSRQFISREAAITEVKLQIDRMLTL